MPTESVEFIDTNVLVYEWDSADPTKQANARKLIRRLAGRGVISSQVAQEFAVIARNKLGLTVDETRRILASYRIFRFVNVDIRLAERAVLTSSESVISFWDALVVEAAAEAGCKVLVTEDLNAGQEIRGVKIVNPFAV